MATKRPLNERRKARLQRQYARERFLRARKAGKAFTRQLRAVAKQVGIIVNGFAPDGVVKDMTALQAALTQYSKLLHPWAVSVASRMATEVGQKDEAAWAEMGRDIGRNLRKEIQTAPTGLVAQQLLKEQVGLITTIPLNAAERVHKLTVEAMAGGNRAKQIAQEIQRQGDVSASDANRIARTEVSRTAGVLTQARAQYVGSEGYIWRTSKDSDVRELHKHLEGKFIRWDDPPVAGSNGEKAHAGCIYYCRCWMEPVIPDLID